MMKSLRNISVFWTVIIFSSIASVITTIYFYSGNYEKYVPVDDEKFSYIESNENSPCYNGDTEMNSMNTTGINIPSIYISTSGEEILKDEYSDSEISVKNTSGDIILDGASAQIKGRGNSTWNYLGDKKPYRIKFDRKQDLFGMGEAKSYVLLANQMDNTLLRNQIALSLAKAMDIEYTSDFIQVHLFLNDEYRGVYLLCEQIQTGSYRVDIETKDGNRATNTLDVGYFIEFGGGIETKHFSIEIINGSKYNWDPAFGAEIKYPEDEALTKQRIAYIKSYIDKVNSAILLKNWEEICNLVDISSMVNYFLLNEIILNGDMGWTTYMYKPAGEKLYIGPPWDFDQTSGNSTFGSVSYEGLDVINGSRNRWFMALMEIPQFMSLVSERYAMIYDTVHKIPEEILSLAAFYKEDFNLNFERWDIIGKDRWRIPDEILNLKTYDENVEYLSKWFENRIKWLDTAFQAFFYSK